MHRAFAALSILIIVSVARGDNEPAMVWVAEGDTNRVFLLGSIHVLREQDHPLPDIVEAVYDEAEQLVMEIDMDDIDPFAALQFLMQNGVLQGDSTLEGVMGAEMYAQAQAAAAELDIPMEMLEKSEPWLAAMTVQEMIMMRVGFKAEFGIEMYLMAKASADGKSITGLETVEQQLGFLDGLSTDTQNRWLLQSIEEGGRMEMLIDEMVAAWRKGDVQFLEQELLLEIDTYPELHNAILVDRNKNWIRPIIDLLDDRDDYLVVVGAAHLVGNNGVPDLLSKQGVRIKQLHEPLR
jgi:uncharacterized protein